MRTRHFDTRIRLGLVASSISLMLGWSVAAALAASPSPLAAAGGAFPTIEAWLDADFIVPDAPPGGVLEAGITLWDKHTHDFAQMGDVYARLLPATGNAAASEGTLESDFPGHFIADLVVPPGGPGSLEVGALVSMCTSDGGCGDEALPFQLTGTGPPPEAPPASLVTATIQPIVGDIVAGRPYSFTVDIVPRGLWDVSAIHLPETLVVTARHAGGAELTSGELLPVSPDGTQFGGKLSIPEPGDIELAVAIGGDGGPDQRIEDSTLRVSVIEGEPRTSARASVAPGAPGQGPAPAEGSGDIPLIVWVVGLGALLIVGAVVLRRAFADL